MADSQSCRTIEPCSHDGRLERPQISARAQCGGRDPARTGGTIEVPGNGCDAPLREVVGEVSSRSKFGPDAEVAAITRCTRRHVAARQMA